MTAYDSIERTAADECEPLRGRRSRTFTLTRLLVACVAVGVCAIGATTVVNTHLVNTHEDSALANFDLGSAVDDDSVHANFDDDYPEGAQLGFWTRRTRPKDKCGSQVSQKYQTDRLTCSKEKSWTRKRYCYMRAYRQYREGFPACEIKKLKAENEKLKAENEKLKAESEKPKAESEKPKDESEKPKDDNKKLQAGVKQLRRMAYEFEYHLRVTCSNMQSFDDSYQKPKNKKRFPHLADFVHGQSKAMNKHFCWKLSKLEETYDVTLTGVENSYWAVFPDGRFDFNNTAIKECRATKSEKACAVKWYWNMPL